MLRSTNKRWFKALTITMAVLHIYQIAFPTIGIAAGTGPGMTNSQGAGTAMASSQLVNLFTGDFAYNIPLMEVDGYPLNLNYNQNVQMNQEASWVGLGWNLNVGAVNRNLRGMPDDFNGDEVTSVKSIAPNTIEGTKEGHGIEFLMAAANWGVGEYNSSYNGPGTEAYGSASLGLSIPILPQLIPFVAWPNRSYGLGYTANSQTGLTVSPSTGWGNSVLYGTLGIGYTKNYNNTMTSYYNSRQGLTHTELNHSQSWNVDINLSLIAQLIIIAVTGGTVPLPPVGVGFGSGTNGSTSVPVGTQSYALGNGMHSVSVGLSNSIARGGTLLGMASYYKTKGDHSSTQMASTLGNGTLNAFGYFNAENAVDPVFDVQDFDREWSGYYIKETMPNISPSQATMDLFSASGAGVASVFRPQRYDVGMNSDNSFYRGGTRVDMMNMKLWGLLSLVFLGLPEKKVKGNTITTKLGGSGGWMDLVGNNIGHSEFDSPNMAPGQVTYDGKVTFKNMGEKTEFDPQVFNEYGGDQPAAFVISEMNPIDLVFLENSPNHHFLTGALETSTGISTPTTDELSDRAQPRQELFSYLSASEASAGAVSQSILNYPFNTDGQDALPAPTGILREADERAGHHMSEVTVTKPDGHRYVYGIPAYSLRESAWSFNASGNIVDNANRLVEYNGNDASVNNDNGRNHYFSMDEVPGYASSFLLTSLLSQDYADKTGDGPTPDDKGDYKRFNYSKESVPYRWRAPYAEGEAAFQENFATDEDDDMGSFMYGEKEEWYLTSIETKHSIAEFYLSERDDAIGVTDEEGAMDLGNRRRKLDKIVLYDRQDREKNGVNAIPIKTVEFAYDYSLCVGVPNQEFSNQGKLTLKSVKISTGGSKRGNLSPYLFSYNDASSSNNYDYGRQDMDRWGNYKPSDAINPNSDIPYAEQDDALADQFARAWKLHEITTPTGSKIKVTYESDDYAYVQNEEAMNMFPIAGIGVSEGTTFSGDNVLFESTGDDPTQFNSFNRVYIDIPDDITTAGEFRSKYLGSQNQFYFKCEVDLNNDDGFETVNGYARRRGNNILNNSGIVDDGGNIYGFIDLRPEPMQEVMPDLSDDIMDDLNFMAWMQPFGLFEDWLDAALGDEITEAETINPIAIAGWQFTRLNLPELIYPFDIQVCELSINPLQCLQNLATTMGADIEALSIGQHGVLKNMDYSSTIDLERSFIRLLDPDNAKKGGGARVSQIEITDAWGDMTSSGSTSTYGNTYVYGSSSKSHGVASYEPILGNDENPLRKPIPYIEDNVLAPDNHHYQEEPLGESFYPSPVVGYSKVEVIPLAHSNVSQHGIGKQVYEFHTAKDFPVIVKSTNLADFQREVDPEHNETFAIDNFSPNLLANSQGFTIEVNDMHGKPKAVTSYATNAIGGYYRYSGTDYSYHTEKDADTDDLKPENYKSVIRANENTSSAFIGMDCQMHIDHLASAGFTISISTKSTRKLGLFNSWNTDFGVTTSYEEYKSIALTKVINRYGILKKVSTWLQDNVVTKEDVHHDPETGQVLVSKVQNDYEHPVYMYLQPAYWAYESFGPGFKNLSTTGIMLTSPGSGLVNVSAPQNHFVEGDEVIAEGGGSGLTHCWIVDVNGTNNTISMVDINGNPFPSAAASDVNLKVIRSGRRNLQVLPMQYKIALESAFSGTKVLESRAFEYSDDWSIYCDDFERCESDLAQHCDDQGNNCDEPIIGGDVTNCEATSYAGNTNPFVAGTRGGWRLAKEWYYDGDRQKSAITNQEDLRNDGTFSTYNPFWHTTSGSNWDITTNLVNWKSAFEHTKIDPDGKVLETRMPDGNYVSVVYGYNQLTKELPMITAYDARYRQIGFDGFEDYDYLESTPSPCGYMDHFSFREGLATVTNNLYTVKVNNTISHTGKHSLEVGPQSVQSMTRMIGECESETLMLGACEELLEKEVEVNMNSCVGTFQPMCGSYEISGWVSIPTYGPIVGYEDLLLESPQIQVRLNNNSYPPTTNYQFEPSGPIINGWQRITGTFDIEWMLEPTCIEIALANQFISGSGHKVYFDDVMIKPVGSQVMAYVYDSDKSRLMATLDNNNFATVLQYNYEGLPVRSKVETIQGFVTSRESYTSLKK